MHIICPHCHNPIEIVKLNAREEIACPSCGSGFHLESEPTTDWQGKTGQKLGKYELLDTVGQGAFGTVYKARDPELDRVVAVKVPRVGNLAGPQELDRFLREARSVAQLRHPAIVPVHDVGQVDGVPYLVSDFVEGVTLSDLLSARRPGFREAAQQVAAVADALQYAHERGVVHRDVKPSNIMIGKDGAAFVMDFGLAKRDAGEITMTVEGQVLGTPAYMPPEQARGEGHAVDARGDVYSLGVVLYQLLTGELPFRGTTRMLLHQVLHDEPRSPRSLNDTIPRDLETIALKAMAKEASRRYASARELADDLRRWQKGEAIHARPVGRIERAARWVKRNPAVAGSLTTVVGVLVTATTVSTLFGIDAQNKETAAVSARKDLAEKKTALEQSQDNLERALARTWLSPLSETSGPLNDAEIVAFTEVAANRNERLAGRYMTEALHDQHGIWRLRARSAFMLHAAVGLDPQMREEVERILVRALEAPDLPDESRIVVALAESELSDLTPPAAAVVAQTLVQALVKTNDVTARQSLTGALSAVSARLEPKAAAAAAAALIQAMNKTNDPNALLSLADGLSAVSARLEPTEAARASAAAAAELTQAMTNTNDPDALRSLAQGLSAVARRLDPKQAKEFAATLTHILTKADKFSTVSALVGALSTLARRLEPKETAAAADTLTQAMTQTNDPMILWKLAEGLSAVSARLEPTEAARVCAAAAATLTPAMTKTNNPIALNYLALSLSALSAHMEPTEAARVSAAAAATLTQAMTHTNDPNALASLAEGLSRVADRLEPKEAAMAAATLTHAVTNTNDPKALWYLVRGLSLVSGRLELKEAAATAATLTQAMTNTNDPEALSHLAEGVSAVAGRLQPTEAARVSAVAAATLTQAMTDSNDPQALQLLAKGLSIVSARLEPTEAARVSALAAARLTQVMTKTKVPNGPYYLMRGLSAVAVRLEPKEAAEAAATITQAMTRTNNDNDITSLAEGLSAVAARLEPKDAAVMLTQAMTRANAFETLSSLAEGLSPVVERLEPKEAARVSAVAAAMLTRAMTRRDNFDEFWALVRGLSAVAGRLEPKEAAEIAATLVQALSKTDDRHLAQGLSAVAARLEPKEGAALLIRTMTKTTDTTGTVTLAHGLAAALGDTQRKQRAEGVAATVAGLHNNLDLPGTAMLLHPAVEPFPRRFTDQELVELLKHPLCVGPARRAVLDHLGVRHRRAFADQWDFVRFAEEEKLGLDFTSPPRPPEAATSSR